MVYILLFLITSISPLLYLVGLLSLKSLIYMGIFIFSFNVIRISTALAAILSVEVGQKIQQALLKFKSGE